MRRSRTSASARTLMAALVANPAASPTLGRQKVKKYHTFQPPHFLPHVTGCPPTCHGLSTSSSLCCPPVYPPILSSRFLYLLFLNAGLHVRGGASDRRRPRELLQAGHARLVALRTADARWGAERPSTEGCGRVLLMVGEFSHTPYPHHLYPRPLTPFPTPPIRPYNLTLPTLPPPLFLICHAHSFARVSRVITLIPFVTGHGFPVCHAPSLLMYF